MRARSPHWFVLLVALAAQGADARAQVDAETLKAAFIYNFAIYTTWPAPPRDVAAITLCVHRASPLVAALRKLSGKPVQGRALALREIDAPAAAIGHCDILITTSAWPAPAPAEPGLLTVCDCEGLPAAAGATIALLREGDRLRFDVDRQAAAAAGLSLSSKLLRLARNAP
jgi:hypothetical protein